MFVAHDCPLFEVVMGEKATPVVPQLPVTWQPEHHRYW
jgi:hypothetical protein